MNKNKNKPLIPRNSQDAAALNLTKGYLKSVWRWLPDKTAIKVEIENNPKSSQIESKNSSMDNIIQHELLSVSEVLLSRNQDGAWTIRVLVRKD